MDAVYDLDRNGNVLLIGNLAMKDDVVSAILAGSKGRRIISDVLQSTADCISFNYDVFLKVGDVIVPKVLVSVDVDVNR